MKREGIEILCDYPVNHLIEHAANADIRPVMVQMEQRPAICQRCNLSSVIGRSRIRLPVA